MKERRGNPFKGRKGATKNLSLSPSLALLLSDVCGKKKFSHKFFLYNQKIQPQTSESNNAREGERERGREAERERGRGGERKRGREGERERGKERHTPKAMRENYHGKVTPQNKQQNKEILGEMTHTKMTRENTEFDFVTN